MESSSGSRFSNDIIDLPALIADIEQNLVTLIARYRPRPVDIIEVLNFDSLLEANLHRVKTRRNTF